MRGVKLRELAGSVVEIEVEVGGLRFFFEV